MRSYKSGVLSKLYELGAKHSLFTLFVFGLSMGNKKKPTLWIGFHDLCNKASTVLLFVLCHSDLEFQLYFDLTVQTDFGLLLAQYLYRSASDLDKFLFDVMPSSL